MNSEVSDLNFLVASGLFLRGRNGSLSNGFVHVYVLLPNLLDNCVELGPTWLGMPGLRTAFAEHIFDFFNGFAACFGVTL